LPARQNSSDAGAHRTFADLQFSFAGNKRGVTDGDAGNIGDSVKRARRTVKRDAKITCAWFARFFFLNLILTFILASGSSTE